jgi:flagellar basal-body rod protein FlgB
MELFNEPTLQAVGAYMSRLSQRQQVVSSNLANIDTPGYKTQDISFHATMQELLFDNGMPLRTELPGHSQGWVLTAPQNQAFEVEGLPLRADRNNVDLDSEMMKLSETSFGYSLMSQILRGKFRAIASSINEGRG